MADILHISDIHFGPPFQPDRARAVRDLAGDLNPDVLVVSGDLTQRARRRQFEAARDFLADFDLPTVVVPGNHDVPLYRVWERMFAPHRKYRRYIRNELDCVHRIAGMVIVALDSTRSFTFTEGRLRRRQLAFVERALHDVPARELRVVVTHHNLAAPPDGLGGAPMPGARRALDVFRRLGVKLVLAGHRHRAFVGQVLDPAAAEGVEGGDLVLVHCGTTTSSRGRGSERSENSLNLIRTRAGELKVTHYLWDGAVGGFRPRGEHRFRQRAPVAGTPGA